ESLHRGPERQEDRPQPAQEGGGVAGVPPHRVAAPVGPPAAEVEPRRGAQRGREPRVEGPGAQGGVEGRAHGGVTGTWGGGRPGGRRLTRTPASAFTSAGLTGFP